MSKLLNDLKSRLSHLNYALKLELMIDPESKYAADLKISIPQVQADIDQLTFARANSVVMVPVFTGGNCDIAKLEFEGFDIDNG